MFGLKEVVNMQVSSYLRELLLQVSVGEEPTLPDEVWLGLHAESPGVDGDGEEANVDRVAVSFGAVANGVIANDAELVLRNAGEEAATITHWGLWTAEVGGELLWFGPLMGRSMIGDSTTEYTVTGSGMVWRYTQTDGKAIVSPSAGDTVIVNAEGLVSGNNGEFVVVNSGEGWFEVVNVDGEEDEGVTGTGEVVRHTPSTIVAEGGLDGDRIVFSAGIIRLRLR